MMQKARHYKDCYFPDSLKVALTRSDVPLECQKLTFENAEKAQEKMGIVTWDIRYTQRRYAEPACHAVRFGKVKGKPRYDNRILDVHYHVFMSTGGENVAFTPETSQWTGDRVLEVSDSNTITRRGQIIEGQTRWALDGYYVANRLGSHGGFECSAYFFEPRKKI